MANTEPALYNSRITRTYIDYLRTNHPNLQIDQILYNAGMKGYEVADDGHWFTQSQVDRFHEIVVAETGDKDISRHAGRFVASAKGLSLIQQYAIGLMTIEAVYAAMIKLFPMLSKGATAKIKKHGTGKIEITSVPNQGVHEKSYQCQNRMGYFEALPKLFTNEYAHIDHPQCVHRGDLLCRYIVTWNTSSSTKLMRICHLSFFISFLLLIALFFIPPAIPKLGMGAGIVCLNILLLVAYGHHKIKEQQHVIETNRRLAEENMASANTNYNNALLVQEIGQATAVIFDVQDLMKKLVCLMNNRLPFDRGLIMLADESAEHLVYSASYGLDDHKKQHFKQTAFKLSNLDSKGAFVRAFLDRKSIVVNDIGNLDDLLSTRSRNLARKVGAISFLCTPIIYEKKSIGIIAVDNIRSKVPLKKSDVNLIEGIASHIAISINNSRSFQKLKESEARYRQTLESLTEGYFELNKEGKITFINKAVCQLLNCAFDDILGNKFFQYFIPENTDHIEALLKSIQNGLRAVRFAHFTMVKKDGGLLPVDLSASLVLDTNNQTVGFRGIIRNATDRLLVEEEKKQLERKLMQAQKLESIGNLAGGIAHNFNNWLSGIMGNVELIELEAQLDSGSIKKIQRIKSIIESAARMTRQLLGYARRGRFKVDLIDVNEVITEAAGTFRVTRKDIAIDLKLTPDIKPIKADKSQIEQVLWNLYINAADAMPGGGQMVIESKNTAVEELKEFQFEIDQADYVSFSVSDTGIGISPEHREQIFEPFFTTKNNKGTGLGLASVYGIIKSHGGYIDVRSSIGKGSTFSILLPIANEVRNVVEQPNHSLISAGPANILLVDDEDTFLVTCCQLLTKLGYTVRSAHNGKEALEIYSAEFDRIDLVIIDMIMPDMPGQELYAHLKNINPNVKAILSSGYSLNEQAKKILDDGCNEFIQKPFNMTQLSELIRKILFSEA